MIKICADSIPPIPWKNGGGVTRDLRVTDAYRISLADIDKDGAFSFFENVTRHLVVVEGEGVFLEFGYDSHRLTPHTPPFTFAGDNPRFKETGVLALEDGASIKRFDFLWFGEEKPSNIEIK